MNLLEVKNLSTTFLIDEGNVQAVRGIDFQLEEGESLGIVGESGSGKSVSMLSIMKLLPDNAIIQADYIKLNGEDISKKNKKFMRTIHGGEIGMIFQDPMTSLNPLMTIGNQLIEGIMIHTTKTKKEAREKAIDLLKLVEIPSAEERIDQYPHEFSGGMRQRVMIAMALSCDPKILIADEPTTALDVTIQAQILDLMNSLKSKLNTSIIMITHDLGVIANMADRILVMYGGTIVEEGTAREIFYNPKHPYTLGLLKSIPSLNTEEKNRLVPIPGSPPDLIAPPKGCPFVDRCNEAMGVCQFYPPITKDISKTQKVSCWLLDSRAQGGAING